MKKVFSFLIILLTIALFNVTNVSCGNDGNLRDDPFGDCGASASFGGDAKYYDFFIPYNATLKDIGGYATDVTFSSTSSYKNSMHVSSSSKLENHPYQFNVQGSKGTSWLGCTVKTDSNTNFQYIEKDGCKFYIASLGKCVFNYSAVTKDGFYQFASLSATGVIYDMILKDGTIIHFATGDGIGDNHTNSDESDSITSGDHDGVYIKFAKLNKKCYADLFHACDPNQTFECFTNGSGALEKFKKYYNISDSNPVVAIRMWNQTISKGGFKVNSGFEELSTKGDAVDTSGATAGGSSNSNTGTGLSIQFMSGYYSELDLASWNKLVEPNIQSQYIEDARRDNLTSKEVSELSNWEQNIDEGSLFGRLIRFLRSMVVLVGILVTIWGIFFYIAYWFDTLNNLIDIDAVKVLSFGRLMKSPEENDCTFHVKDLIKSDGQPRTINHKIAIFIAIGSIAFGCLLVSGYFYKILGFFITKIIGFLS